jgi:hypothetical protein
MVEQSAVEIGNYQRDAWNDCELEVAVPKGLAQWSFASNAAHFFADWLKPILHQSSSAQSVDYAVNELLENAIKYASDGSIEMRLSLQHGRLSVSLRNALSADNSARFAKQAIELSERDTVELFAEIIERNSQSEATQSGAGLGLVSLVNDHGAQLGFAFEHHANDQHHVTCQVHLPLNEDPS